MDKDLGRILGDIIFIAQSFKVHLSANMVLVGCAGTLILI